MDADTVDIAEADAVALRVCEGDKLSEAEAVAEMAGDAVLLLVAVASEDGVRVRETDKEREGERVSLLVGTTELVGEAVGEAESDAVIARVMLGLCVRDALAVFEVDGTGV